MTEDLTPEQLEWRAKAESIPREDHVLGYNPSRNLSAPVSSGYSRSAPSIRLWNYMVYANNKGLSELTGFNPSTISGKLKCRDLLPSRIKFPFGTGKGNKYYALTPEFLEKMNIDPALVTNWRRENDPKFREPSNV